MLKVLGMQNIDKIVDGVLHSIGQCKVKPSRAELASKIRRHYLYKRGQATSPEDGHEDNDDEGK